MSHIELKQIPAAASVGVFFCGAPECRMPHVGLYDADGVLFAHFVVPDSQVEGRGFMHDLYAAVLQVELAR